MDAAKGNLSSLIESTKATLLEGLALIQSVGDDCYAKAPPAIRADSAGNHLRHCLGFFECFLEGLDSMSVDYATRRRDQSGRDRLLGMAKIKSIVGRLGVLEDLDHSSPLLVRAEDEAQPVWTHSTVGRELEFLRSHTVHHYALIALAIRCHQAPVPQSFGVAPSTIRFHVKESACAP